MRIMIIGRPGSGKSTFAVQLQAKIHLPVYHLDKYFFESHWVERDYASFIADQVSIVSQDQWIIDGNSSKSFEQRYARADYCIYFNVARWRCYWRVFKRLFHKDRRIDDRAPSCPETIRWSLLKYMWGCQKRVATILTRLRCDYPNVYFLELNADCEARELLANASKVFQCNNT